MLASYPVAVSRLPSLEPRICIINTVSVQAKTASEPCLRVQSSRHISLNLLADKGSPYRVLQLSFFGRIHVTSGLVVSSTF